MESSIGMGNLQNKIQQKKLVYHMVDFLQLLIQFTPM